MALSAALERARDAHRAGRLDDARQGYEAALQTDPDDADALHLLGVLCHQTGDATRAFDLLDRAISQRNGFAEALNNRGAFRQGAGDVARALADFRAAAEADADFADAWLNLGCLVRIADGAAAALGPFQRAAAAAPDLIEAQGALGECLAALGRRDEALAVLENALALNAAHAPTLCNKGKVLNDIGRFDDAIQVLQAAVSAAPDFAEAWNNLANARVQAGDAAGGIDAYRRAIDCRPGFGHAERGLAQALAQDGRTDEAVAAYRQAAASDPANAAASNGLAGLLLGQGDSEGALAAVTHALDAAPGDTTALAQKGTALIAAGRLKDAEKLNRLDTFVTPRPMAPPTGYADMAAFNQALAEHVLAHPSLTEDPSQHATRHGRHSGELLVEPMGPMAGFRDMVLAAAAEYRDGLDGADDHPFIQRRPHTFRLTAWAVVMRAEGHQVAHIHGSSWLSGVYYPRLPAIVDAVDGRHAGWIEFGQPPEGTPLDHTPPLRILKPEEGLLVLFPSFLYHRTIAYQADQQRISIAFDVMPG